MKETRWKMECACVHAFCHSALYVCPCSAKYWTGGGGGGGES